MFETFFNANKTICDGNFKYLSVKTPGPEKFFNRKGYYSLNVLVICDHLKRIRYFLSRHAGSTHDSKIFYKSYLRQTLESNFNPADPRVLIGDEGYGCTKVSYNLELFPSWEHIPQQNLIKTSKARSCILIHLSLIIICTQPSSSICYFQYQLQS